MKSVFFFFFEKIALAVLKLFFATVPWSTTAKKNYTKQPLIITSIGRIVMFSVIYSYLNEESVLLHRLQWYIL